MKRPAKIFSVRLRPVWVPVLVLVACSSAFAQDGAGVCRSSNEMALVNARILTMNAGFSEASNVLIRDSRIVEVGDSVAINEDCTEVIDVGGRTVIPGLIDSHIHFVRQGNMPGHDTREAEAATSIQELQTILRRRAETVPAGEAIAVMGGMVPRQLLPEQRLPNLQELDDISTEHILFVQIGFAGPGVTNTRGKDVFEANGVVVEDDGAIAVGKDTAMAFGILRKDQTGQDRARGLRELMTYANSVGLTTVHDEGGVEFPGAGLFDPESDYDTLVNLWRAGESTVRVRAHFTSYDTEIGTGQVEDRLNYAWNGIGDDMLKSSALGEHIVTFPTEGKVSEVYGPKVAEIARRGWTHEQHSVSEAENLQHLAEIIAADEAHGIDGLRWSLAHVFEMGDPASELDLDQLANRGMGLKLQSQGYVGPTDRFPLGRTLGGENSGPLYRTLYDRGDIPLGAGTDGILVVPMSPWFGIYYMTTGKDNTGALVNPGQALSRLEALRLYTTGSAWFTYDEDDLGSIEVGKLADIVVLSDDYLEVEDEALKHLRAVLTMVDGKVVYRDPGFQ